MPDLRFPSLGQGTCWCRGRHPARDRIGSAKAGSRAIWLERAAAPAAALVLVALAGYLGCAPICLRRVIESKYWRLSLILLPSNVKKMAAGVSWVLPDAGFAPSPLVSRP